jgi:hypothetical protein
MMRIIRRALLALSVLCASPCLADAYIEAVPTTWRLQNYIGSNMYVWFTGSPCAGGSLVLGASVSTDDKNRFWALVLTAKASQKTVGIYYETTSGVCNITSFYMPN